MKEQLIQYVELLFAGASDCEDMKQEILQNTLDRYEDLIAAGKVPEAAYRLAIAGIGDVSEILGTTAEAVPVKAHSAAGAEDHDTAKKKLLRAIAVGLYILAALPLIVLGDLGMDNLGLCGTLFIVAVATVLILLGAKKDPPEKEDHKEETQSELSKSITDLIWAVGLGAYLLLSFSTKAWHITWIIFLVLVALDSLVSAIIRNQEAKHGYVMPSGSQTENRHINSLIWASGTAVYFIFSFATGAWYISWLLFPITGTVQGLVYTILDLKGARNHAIIRLILWSTSLMVLLSVLLILVYAPETLQAL